MAILQLQYRSISTLAFRPFSSRLLGGGGGVTPWTSPQGATHRVTTIYPDVALYRQQKQTNTNGKADWALL